MAPPYSLGLALACTLFFTHPRCSFGATTFVRPFRASYFLARQFKVPKWQFHQSLKNCISFPCAVLGCIARSNFQVASSRCPKGSFASRSKIVYRIWAYRQFQGVQVAVSVLTRCRSGSFTSLRCPSGSFTSLRCPSGSFSSRSKIVYRTWVHRQFKMPKWQFFQSIKPCISFPCAVLGSSFFILIGVGTWVVLSSS